MYLKGRNRVTKIKTHKNKKKWFYTIKYLTI